MALRVRQIRPDLLVIETPRQWKLAALVSSGIALWAALWVLFGLSTLPGFVMFALGAIGVPVAAVAIRRLLVRVERHLVRVPGRLLLDQDPIELARVELRVVERWWSKQPRGYVLSLWLMTSSGPEDLQLGRFATLLEASSATGLVEEFVQKANLKQPGATRAR